jgi:hypothetical protein
LGIYEMKKPKKINSFSVTLALIVAALVYLGYFFLPVWWPIFQETGIMQGICNDAYREYSDEKLMEKLLKESKRTRLPLTKENFVLERVKYDDVELSKFPEASRDFVQGRGKECRLTMTFTSNAEWPFIGKKSQISWNRTVRTDLGLVKY